MESSNSSDEHCLSDSEILINLDKSKVKRVKSKKKLSPNEEVLTDWQFDHFNEERMAVKVPCDVKFGTTVARVPIWIKNIKCFVMSWKNNFL